MITAIGILELSFLLFVLIGMILAVIGTIRRNFTGSLINRTWLLAVLFMLLGLDALLVRDLLQYTMSEAGTVRPALMSIGHLFLSVYWSFFVYKLFKQARW